jgi:hypothetical protein
VPTSSNKILGLGSEEKNERECALRVRDDDATCGDGFKLSIPNNNTKLLTELLSPLPSTALETACCSA